MKTQTQHYKLPLIVIGSALFGSAQALAASAGTVGAQGNQFAMDGKVDTEFGSSATALSKLMKFISFGGYIIGSVMMAMSGFKLKAGDLPGFFKMLAGGAFIFLCPFLINNLSALSSKDASTAN